MSVTMIILAVLGAVCLLGAALVMRYAFTYDKPKPSHEPPAPLPGREGGGIYTMHLREVPEDREKLLSALQSVPRIHASMTDDRTVSIRYEGFPSIDLLDTLRTAAESAGAAVESVE